VTLVDTGLDLLGEQCIAECHPERSKGSASPSEKQIPCCARDDIRIVFAISSLQVHASEPTTAWDRGLTEDTLGAKAG
jgi:hypothetical protein